ncbi:MAG: hypothetical protein P0S95_07000 [Rhabdochlamydiaceae bacterium]|nr:hypothetical protein [Candidatus Amphrikana amoebophyrae]
MATNTVKTSLLEGTSIFTEANKSFQQSSLGKKAFIITAVAVTVVVAIGIFIAIAVFAPHITIAAVVMTAFAYSEVGVALVMAVTVVALEQLHKRKLLPTNLYIAAKKELARLTAIQEVDKVSKPKQIAITSEQVECYEALDRIIPALKKYIADYEAVTSPQAVRSTPVDLHSSHSAPAMAPPSPPTSSALSASTTDETQPNRGQPVRETSVREPDSAQTPLAGGAQYEWKGWGDQRTPLSKEDREKKKEFILNQRKKRTEADAKKLEQSRINAVQSRERQRNGERIVKATLDRFRPQEHRRTAINLAVARKSKARLQTYRSQSELGRFLGNAKDYVKGKLSKSKDTPPVPIAQSAPPRRTPHATVAVASATSATSGLEDMVVVRSTRKKKSTKQDMQRYFLKLELEGALKAKSRDDKDSKISAFINRCKELGFTIETIIGLLPSEKQDIATIRIELHTNKRATPNAATVASFGQVRSTAVDAPAIAKATAERLKKLKLLVKLAWPSFPLPRNNEYLIELWNLMPSYSIEVVNKNVSKKIQDAAREAFGKSKL